MRTVTVVLLGAGLMMAASCGAEETSEESRMAMDSATMAMGADSGMMSMGRRQMGPPQDAEHEFLRMMTDHHEGLVAMGTDAMNRAADDSVKSAAHRMHTKQAAQQDTMVAMIRRMYNESHTPSIMPKNAAQADSLRTMTGIDVDRYFLRTTIAHHQEGVGMIDRLLPRFTRPDVRQMAEGMRVEQQREIEELQGKLDDL